MKFTELATEVLNRCGEGYQDYLARCKEHLKFNFERMMNSPEFTDRDYYGLVKIYSDTFDGDPIEVNTINADLFKIISVQVKDVDYDFIEHEIIKNKERVSAFFSKQFYYFWDGGIIFASYEGEGEVLNIKYLQRYVPEIGPETDLLNTFSDNFVNRAIDITVETMSKEIRG